MSWVVGSGETCELSWRSDTLVFDLCSLWVREFVAVDVCHFNDGIIDSSSETRSNRCSKKYGKYWDEYRSLVKWVIIPGFY